jgi:hypothetical protein
MRARYPLIAVGTALLCTALLGPAIAGDADHEITDDHENGTPYFGEVKDVAGLKPIESARVKAQIKGTFRFLVGQSDADGRFKIRGLGPEIDPNTVDVTCEASGYRVIDTIRTRPSKAADAPVEIECLMEKAGKPRS